MSPIAAKIMVDALESKIVELKEYRDKLVLEADQKIAELVESKAQAEQTLSAEGQLTCKNFTHQLSDGARELFRDIVWCAENKSTGKSEVSNQVWTPILQDRFGKSLPTWGKYMNELLTAGVIAWGKCGYVTIAPHLIKDAKTVKYPWNEAA